MFVCSYSSKKITSFFAIYCQKKRKIDLKAWQFLNMYVERRVKKKTDESPSAKVCKLPLFLVFLTRGLQIYAVDLEEKNVFVNRMSLASVGSVSSCLGPQSCHRHGSKIVPAQTAEITKCDIIFIVFFKSEQKLLVVMVFLW